MNNETTSKSLPERLSRESGLLGRPGVTSAEASQRLIPARRFQSLRSVTAGSTRPALRAGPSPASKAVTSNNAGAAVSAITSPLPTPFNWVFNARPAIQVRDQSYARAPHPEPQRVREHDPAYVGGLSAEGRADGELPQTQPRSVGHHAVQSQARQQQRRPAKQRYQSGQQTARLEAPINPVFHSADVVDRLIRIFFLNLFHDGRG